MTLQVRSLDHNDKKYVLDLAEKVWVDDTRFCLDALWDWKHGWDSSAKNQEYQCAKVILKQGRLIGYSGMLPVEFMIDGELECGGAILDTYIDPDDRGAGVKLMRKQIFEQGVHYGLAMPRLKELCSKLLKRDVTIRTIKKRYFFVDPVSIFKKRLPSKIAIITYPLSCIWNLCLTIRRAFVVPKLPYGYKICEIEKFDKEIDIVWLKFAADFRFSLLRHADYLNWRFVATPFGYRKLLLRDEEKIVACIIFRTALYHDQAMIIIAEAFAIGHQELNYLLLLDKVFLYAKKHQASRIGAMDTGCSAFKRALDKMGFFSRLHQSMPMIGSWVDASKPTDKIYDSSGWYISPTDTDIELVLFDQLHKNAIDYAINIA
jgi:hypothetical protein